MKKLLIILFFIVCIYSNLPISKAISNATVYLEADKTIVKKGEEIEISFYIKDLKTTSYLANIYFDENKFDFVYGTESTNLDGNIVKIIWYDSLGGRGAKKGELAKIVFKAKENGISNFVIDGEFFDEGGEAIQTNFESLQIQIEEQQQLNQEDSLKSNNANLQSLGVNIEGIVPQFQPEIYEYNLEVLNNIKDIEVMAVSENPRAKVNVKGNTNLKEGVNVIKIDVISEDNSVTKEYRINVTKTVDLELSNANLENLAIENVNLMPNFDSQVTNYTAEVSDDVESLNVLAVAENENAKIEVNGGNNLLEGNNELIITVTAPNKLTKRVYKVDVYKRNSKQEEVYVEEQNQMPQRLENAYKIEKISAETSNSVFVPETIKLKDNKNYMLVVILVGIILITIVIWGLVVYYRSL